MSERVGYIGLGIMGRPMALNLRKAGHELWVFARRETAMAPLVAAGATPCSSPREVAERADVVFVNVSDTPDVEEVVLGPDGIVHGARSGTLVIDNSTISPTATRRIADVLREKGVEMLDAPVSGGQQGAIEGTLSVMVGGTVAAFERALPLLRAVGRNVVHVGDSGAGQVAKACNQVVIAQTVAGIAEGLLLATAAGVDPARVREALLGGFAASRALEVHGQRMLDRNYTPGFMARLHKKDMRIVLETARELGVPMPGAALVTEYIDALVDRGDGELDSAALATVLEGMAGLEIGAPRIRS
jgi:2-hydroxy-3-oxopropionate reductase